MSERPHSITFTVIGLPVPQGSKRHVGNGVMVETAKGHKSWRADVTDAARVVAPAEPLAGPVSVHLRFQFLPVASDPYRSLHATTPDADKCARAVLDAMKVARIYVDDSRVWMLKVSKVYAGPGEMPGVDVEVHDDTEMESWERDRKKRRAADARSAAKANA